jgi:hypothetical protein
VTLDVTERLDCSGTAYVNDPAAEMPIELELRSDLPQFTSPGLDPSLFEDLLRILLGRTMIEIARDFQNGVDWERALRRVAYAVQTPHEHSVQLYVCSDKLCKLLSSLDEQRTNNVAHSWSRQSSPAHPDGGAAETRYQYRIWILQQLVTLSRLAESTGKKLMLRVEYRRCMKDPTTGRVHRNEGTRH